MYVCMYVYVCVCVCMYVYVYVCAEREENVKTDIFTAYRALLTVTQSQTAVQSQSGEPDGMDVADR